MEDKNEDKYVVSACLAGFNCRFDGSSKPCPEVVQLYKEGRAIPVCPESLSGLKSPRSPAEWKDGKIKDREGNDKTGFFRKGAELALQKALNSGSRKAILKSRSPSCGFGKIYDGTFSHTLCDGNGCWTNRLIEHDFQIFTEENLPDDLNSGKYKI